MPKDIRSFFKAPAGGAAKPATGQAVPKEIPKETKPAPEKKRTHEATEDKVVKRSRHFDSRDKQQQSAGSPAKSKSARTSPAKKAASKEPATKKPKTASPPTAKKPAPRGAARKKPIIIDSDDEPEESSEVEEPSEAELESESGSDIDVDVGESDDEIIPTKKSRGKADSKPVPKAEPIKAKAAKPANTTAARKLPSSLATPAPAAGTPKVSGAAAPASQSQPKSSAKASGKKKDKPPEDPSAKAAQTSVDAAIKKLPPESKITFTVMEPSTEGFNQRGGGDPPPPNHGQKDIPRGHPDCLAGKTFVLTGVLDSLYRTEAEDLIKRHSGRVTGSISGRTNFLLVGQQCGNSKTRQAKEKGTMLIDEDGLFSLIAATKEPKAPSPPPLSTQPAPAPAAKATPDKAAQQQKASASAGPSSSRPSMQAGPSSAAAALNQHGRAAPSGLAAAGTQLWVEKHKPQTSAELVGNGTVIATLKQWLQEWDAVHLRHQAPTEGGKGRGTKTRDLTKKAVLLSGPPGIGKTSSALILARELGFQPVEVNASDTRNKADSNVKGIDGKKANALRELINNASLSMQQGGARVKVCLIMDEVDGMSGGDRGGVQELIKAIARSKVPIIAICNEKYNQKLRSLRNHTLELDYRKPTRQQIAKRMAQICRAEGLQTNDTTLEALAEGANADIRLVLGQLQMVRLRARALSYDDVKSKMATNKDSDMSPFEAARKLLSTESLRMSLGERVDLVFQDMDLVPLLIQENYLNHRPGIARNDGERLRAIAKASDALSSGDIVNRAVRQYGNWGLMPFAAMTGSVAPACYMRGMRETFNMYPGEPNFPRFSAWFGTNSSSGKQRRLLGELHTRMAASGVICADRTSLRTSYLPTLRRSLTQPLVTLEKEGIEPVIQIMQEYCMGKEQFEFVLDVTKFKTQAPWGQDPFKPVPAQVKSAFTRQFNQAGLVARTNIMVEDFKRRRGKKGAAAAAAAEDDEEGTGGDPEMESAVKPKEGSPEEEEVDEEVAKRKAKQLSRKGITFQAKDDGKAKGGKRAAPAGGRGAGAAKRGRGAATGRGAGRGKK